jgi:hypothetical protein
MEACGMMECDVVTVTVLVLVAQLLRDDSTQAN